MRSLIYILSALFVTGCSMAPRIDTNIASLPTRFLYADSVVGDTISLEWWLSFNDTTLNRLIDSALVNNKSYAAALLNVQSSRLNAANVRSELFPSLSLSAQGSASYNETTKITQNYSVMPTISWDVDLFGRIRSLSESAKAQYLSTVWGARAARVALAAEVATTYFSLLQYQASYDIAQLTYISRVNSLNTIDTMLKYGVTTLISYDQARSLTISARESVSQYKTAIEQTAISLASLTGVFPSELMVYGGKPNLNIDIPVGLPSMLLERRPDVIESYYNLISENYQIGAARAERLPNISLTGDGGFIKSIVNDLSTGRPIGWGAAASLAQPLYAFGRNKRNVEIAKLSTQSARLSYEQSMITAVGEVETALSSIEGYRKRLNDAAVIVIANQRVQELTRELYYTGSGDYLNVLDAERNYFSSRLQYEELAQQLSSAYVSLYKALGGGFNQK